MKKPVVKLIGEDGNVFSIIGRVSKALKHEGMNDKAKEFTDKTFASNSYEEVLKLVMDYVEVG